MARITLDTGDGYVELESVVGASWLNMHVETWIYGECYYSATVNLDTPRVKQLIATLQQLVQERESATSSPDPS